MPLPYSFLLGLFCLFAAPDLVSNLPHDVTIRDVAPYLPLVFAPWLFCRILSVRVGRPDSPGAQIRIRMNHWLQTLSVPASYLSMLSLGEFGLWVDGWVPPVLVLGTLAYLAPLLAMEFGVNLARRQAVRQLPYIEAVIGPAPFHFTLVAFLTTLVLMFTGSLDLIGLHRGLYVFVVSTALGNLIWIITFVGVLCVVLPSVFRLVANTSGEVPEDARKIATLLGFPPKRVQLLGTNNRLINAMLVGPVPGFRYLFLTDGIVDLLDPVSLRGVVAHEVGHARANHPFLLLMVFGLVPLLLFSPLEVIGLTELDSTSLVAVLALGAATAFVVVKRLAHRFELEADLISADALGGSAPCILALHKVSQLSGARPGKDSLRHPSEESRILHLLSCEGDPWFRERFEKRGRQVRRGVAVFAVVAMGLSVWAQSQLWPVDKLILQYFTGRFPEAQATLDTMPAKLPPGRDGIVEHLREQLTAARLLCPEGGEWSAIRDDLSARALRRGRLELLRNGPRTARPWFSIGMAKTDPTNLEITLFLYCEAEASDDSARAAELRDHLLRSFDLEPDLRRALTD